MILQSISSSSKYLYIYKVWFLLEEKVGLSSRDLTKSFKMLETVNIVKKNYYLSSH